MATDQTAQSSTSELPLTLRVCGVQMAHANSTHLSSGLRACESGIILVLASKCISTAFSFCHLLADGFVA